MSMSWAADSPRWRRARLGDLLRLINGRAYNKYEERESGTPVLRIQNLNGGNRWFYSELSLPSDKYCESGDLLYAWSATFGPYIWRGERAIFHYHIWKVECGPELEKRFAYYLLQHITERVKAAGRGISMLHMTKGGMEDWEVEIPPLDEQRRIAAILDQADELRRKRQQALTRLNQLGQAIFIEMFGEWDRPGANVQTLQLGDHIDFLTSGSRGWAEYYSDDGALFLRIQNVRRDELDLADVAFVQAPATAEANRTRVQSGDVLLSITADLGRTAVVPEGLGEAYINQHLAIIRAKRFDPRFLSAALSSPSGQRLILKRNREGVKAALNFDDVRSVLIPDASADRQREYGTRANAVDGLKKSEIAALAEAEKLFTALQHRAFTGQLTASALKEVAA